MGDKSAAAQRKRWRPPRLFVFLLLALGILMVTASSAYLALAARADSQLDRLKALANQNPPMQGLPTLELAPGQFVLQSSLGSPFPGNQTDPIFWDSPVWARELAYDKVQAQGYSPVSLGSLPSTGSNPLAVRIRIPVINVDSPVKDLMIQDLGDYRAYETPNNVVGHIPSTATPGEIGNGWYFGHLESFIRGEGSVFRSLPKIPDLLRQGQAVYIMLDSAKGSYLYRVSEWKVLYQDELSLFDSSGPDITLVTCVPSFKYDYRLLVTAKLVGVK